MKYSESQVRGDDRSSMLRSPYFIIILAFIASRAAYYLLGVRFDARGVDWFFQFLDPALLRHRLLESLFYLHMQPPGYNLFLGIVLKLFPHDYAAAFQVIHCTFGAAITCSLFYLMRCFGIGARSAMAVTVLFMISPGTVLFENFILYEYQMMFFLTLSAVFLYRFFNNRSAWSAIGFLVCQFWLVMIRNQFHLVYFAVIFAVILYFAARQDRRLVGGVGSVLLAVILALFVKNQVLFGHFASSTWHGVLMATITTHQLTAEERRQFIANGSISSAPDITQIVPLPAFYPYITRPPETSIPALDQELKPSGVSNFNNIAFLKVQELAYKDGLFIFFHYPKAYARSLAKAWFAYFLPAGDFLFFDMNMPHIRRIERFFEIVYCGQFMHTGDRQSLKQMTLPTIVLHTGIFLLLGLPALFIFGVTVLCRGVRAKTLTLARSLLLGFMLFNIAYGTAIANFLSSIENNRYRFPLETFFVVLAAMAGDRLWRLLKAKSS